MAQWKQIVVSGSNISQLSNDAGYVLNQGSSGIQLNGSFTGSFTGSAFLPPLSQGVGIAPFSYNGSTPTTLTLTNGFTDGGGIAGQFGSSTQVPVLTIDAQGRITTASLSTISTTLSISGDSGTDSVSLVDGTLNINGSTGIATAVTDDVVTLTLGAGIVSGSSVSSPGQGQVQLTTNGLAASAIDLGLETTDDVTFNSVNVTGDATVDGNLTINGDLVSIRTTNLEVEDKYILLNSGSSNPDTAGIVVDQGSGAGDAFIFDATDLRWGVNKNIAATTGSANSEAHVSLVIDESDGNHVDEAYYQKPGNIKVDTSGNIFMYT
jgi:hypothetical protein|tara:strand:- start:4109 stop:5074 length:966 start_codon:yes stop_codon:yes gene_type:complete